jgi:membrane-associated phospholipid phosphatase
VFVREKDKPRRHLGPCFDDDAVDPRGREFTEDDGADREIEAPRGQLVDRGPALPDTHDVATFEVGKRSLALRIVIDDQNALAYRRKRIWNDLEHAASERRRDRGPLEGTIGRAVVERGLRRIARGALGEDAERALQLRELFDAIVDLLALGVAAPHSRPSSLARVTGVPMTNVTRVSDRAGPPNRSARASAPDAAAAHPRDLQSTIGDGVRSHERRIRPRLARLVLALIGFIGASCGARDARADDASSPGGSPYRLKWAYDSALVGIGAAGALTAFLGHPKPACHPGCAPPADLLGIDRGSVGNYSPSAHSLASVVVAGLVLAPLVIDAADTRFHGWAEDTFVLLETILLTQAPTQITKSAVGRTAPFVYNPHAAEEDLDSADAFRSYFSGHTSTAFASATAYAVTFWKRHPDSAWRFVVVGVGEALALGVGLLKIKAGYHYPTDVAAGALVGGAMGLLLPVLHSEW